MKNQPHHLKSPRGIPRISGLHSTLLAVTALAFAGLLAVNNSAHAQVLVDWTFEQFTAATGQNAGPYAPEVNNLGNGTTPAVTINTGGTISSPAGNGSAHSYSSNTWGTGKYFQFTLNTTGVTGPLGISYDQAGSSTGPRDFAVQYSTDSGATFTTLANSAYQLTTASFAPGTFSPAFTHSFDFTNVADLTNVTGLVFRVTEMDAVSIGGGTVASTGTDRIDNFILQTVPEPTTVCGGALLVAAAAWSQRRRLRAALPA